MKTLYPVPPDPSTDPVSLTAAAVHSLIQPLPSGTAFCIGIVLIVMMTGRLVQTKGSLARAVLPFVVHLRWGWHRVERAMERGAFSLDTMFDQAMDWCMRQLPVEPVRLGMAQREVNAIDSSTIVRLRAGKRLALAGKGYCHRAGRAVRANIVAALTTVVMIEGVRVGLVRRTRFGASCEEAVARVFAALPPPQGTRLLVVDAGIATQEQFAAATAQDALLGRLRINAKLRCAPPPPTGNPGRRPVHGAVIHPGRALPEVAPDLERRISVALLAGSLLKAIAAVCAPQAMGPWDRQPVRSAGRLANYLDIHAWHFAPLALQGAEPRNYCKKLKGLHRKELRRRKAA